MLLGRSGIGRSQPQGMGRGLKQASHGMGGGIAQGQEIRLGYRICDLVVDGCGKSHEVLLDLLGGAFAIIPLLMHNLRLGSDLGHLPLFGIR